MGKHRGHYEHTAEVLNRMTEGGGYHTIAEETKTSSSTVFEIRQAYPLWEYFRQHPQD